MKESKFIEHNSETWREFESYVSQKKIDPEKLSFLFLKLTDDLSYARTHYPNRLVRQYLNDLAQTVFYKIYKNRKVDLDKIKHFWVTDLPSLIWNSRIELTFTFTFFVFAMMIGVVSSIYEPEFIRIILGDHYVDMTLENIGNGDPMAVYKKSNEVNMFLGITFNNIMVSLNTFLSGALAIVGSLYIMFTNGIMLGSFQYFFIEKGLFWESFLTIWQHGVLEISSIIISGASGIIMGKGLLFTGTYSRSQSFRISAKKGLNLFISVIPILIIAGFIEGFFTRYTDANVIIRVISILASLSFIVYVFIYRPFKLHKQGRVTEIIEEENLSEDIDQIELYQLKNGFDIFNDTIMFVKSNFRSLIGESFLVTALYSTLLGAYLYYTKDVWAINENSSSLLPLEYSFSLDNISPYLYILHLTYIGFIIYRILLKIDKGLNTERIKAVTTKRIMYTVFFVLMILSIFTIQNSWFRFISIISLPWLYYFFALGFFYNQTFEGAFLKSSSSLKSNHIVLIGISTISVLLFFVIIIFVNSPIVDISKVLFSMSVFSGNNISITIGSIFYNILGWMLLIFINITLLTSMFIGYFSFVEKNESITLNKEIDALFNI